MWKVRCKKVLLPQITKLTSSPDWELEPRAFPTPELEILTISLDGCHKI